MVRRRLSNVCYALVMGDGQWAIVVRCVLQKGRWPTESAAVAAYDRERSDMPWPKGKKRPEMSESSRALMSSPEHQAKLIAGRVKALKNPKVRAKYQEHARKVARLPKMKGIKREQMLRMNADPVFQEKAQRARRAKFAAREAFTYLAMMEAA